MKTQNLNGLSIHTRINTKKHLAQPNQASIYDGSTLIHISIIHPLHEAQRTASFLGRILREERVKSSARQDFEWFNTFSY